MIKINKKYVIIKQSNWSKLQGKYIIEDTKNNVLKVTTEATFYIILEFDADWAIEALGGVNKKRKV